MIARVTLLTLLIGCEEVTVPLGVPTAPPSSTPTTTTTTPGTTTGFVDAFTHQDPVLDVLAVVDASCSMSDDLQTVNELSRELVDELLAIGFDFHAGATTTGLIGQDPGLLRPDGKGALWTDALTPAAADRFVEQTGVGNIGQATEQGLNSVEEALTTQATLANAGFRRPDGQLAVVLIADEDDQSPQTPKSVVKTLEGLGSFTDDVTFSRVSGCKGFEHPRYEGVVDAIGGAEADLCDVDPAAFVADLTALWWTSNAYELTNTPDPTTLELWVDEGKGFVLLDASCWVYDAAFDTVRLSGCTLTAGTSIEARYD